MFPVVLKPRSVLRPVGDPVAGTHVTQHMPAIRAELFFTHLKLDSLLPYIHYSFPIVPKPRSVQSVTRSHTHVTQHMPALRPEYLLPLSS